MTAAATIHAVDDIAEQITSKTALEYAALDLAERILSKLAT